MVSTLVSIYFGNPRFGHTIKTNCKKIQTVDPEIQSTLVYKKESKASLFTTFRVRFIKKNVLCYILLTDQISLSD